MGGRGRYARTIPPELGPPETEHLIAAGAPLLARDNPMSQNSQDIHSQRYRAHREFLPVLAASAVWAGATPCFGALVRPKPSRLLLGSPPPKLHQIDLARDIVDDVAVNSDDDNGTINDRDT